MDLASGAFGSTADLSAYRVFLMIERVRFLAREMASALAGQAALLAPDMTILPVQRCCLRMRDLSLAHLFLDPLVLMGQTMVDFGAGRVVLLPDRFGRSGRTET